MFLEKCKLLLIIYEYDVQEYMYILKFGTCQYPNTIKLPSSVGDYVFIS